MKLTIAKTKKQQKLEHHWKLNYTKHKLEEYNIYKENKQDSRIQYIGDEEKLRVKSLIHKRKKEINAKYTITQEQIENRKKQNTIQLKKEKLESYMEKLKEKWEKWKLMDVQFFREILKNIGFSLHNAHILENLKGFWEIEIPKQEQQVKVI